MGEKVHKTDNLLARFGEKKLSSSYSLMMHFAIASSTVIGVTLKYTGLARTTPLPLVINTSNSALGSSFWV